MDDLINKPKVNGNLPEIKSPNSSATEQTSSQEFDKEQYEIWKLPHPVLIHWILNPGLAFNELILGQKIPKILLIDKKSDAPLMERSYVPCLKCSALNDARLWSKGNSFGHWFGYICPKCHSKIPCLWNLTSIIILTLTFPIWIWLKLFVEAKWLEKGKKRFSAVAASGLPEAKKISWFKMGISFGVIMFCLMALPVIVQTHFSLSVIAFLSAISLSAGLAFGIIMKLILSSKK